MVTRAVLKKGKRQVSQLRREAIAEKQQRTMEEVRATMESESE